MTLLPPPAHAVDAIIEAALAEDLGAAGDLTSNAIFGPEATTSAGIVARADGVIAGLSAALGVFGHLDDNVEVDAYVSDADAVSAGTVLARLHGTTRALLTGERTCLNLLGHLSGIATATRSLVDAVDGAASIADTRKTTPGLRALEKYAVRCGGGKNHRFGLNDAVMLKDNHIAAAGSITAAVAAVKAAVGHLVAVEVEVDRIDQLPETIEAGADVILLDNMDAATLRKAVGIVDGRAVTEASGGITPQTAPALAATGVDVLSLGWLTHSSPSLDVALEIDA